MAERRDDVPGEPIEEEKKDELRGETSMSRMAVGREGVSMGRSR